MAVALSLGGIPAIAAADGRASPAPPPARATAGVAAPPQTVVELRRALDDAVRRFEARDAAGVLGHVSDRYRTSPMTKRRLRDHLDALFGLYDLVRARVRIDEVRLVGDQAWVWSSGEVVGRLAWVGRWMSVLSWERELEVARREGGRWRLYGYQQ
jgi:hypothetical protein